MGGKNSKIIPELKEDKDYFTCVICNMKIHSSCQKYYLKKKININKCIKCHNL